MSELRLRDVQTVLKENAAKLQVETRGLGGNNIDIGNRDTLRLAATSMTSVPMIHRAAQTVLRHAVFAAQSTVVANTETGPLQRDVAALRQQADTILAFLDEVLPDAPETYFAVTMPVTSQTFDGASKDIKRLHLALDHPVRTLGHSPLRLNHGEPGSLLLEIGVPAGAMTFIGAMLKLANQHLKNKQEATKVEQERLKVEQERLKLEQEAAKVDQEEAKAEQERLKLEQARWDRELVIGRVRQESQHLEEERWIDEICAAVSEPNAAAVVVREAVTELTSLLADGARFRLQLDAPPTVRAAFPSDTVVPIGGVKPKELPAHADDEE